MDIKYYCTSLYFNCSYLSSALNVKVLNLIEEGLVRLDGSQRGLAGEGAVGADVGVLVIAEVDLDKVIDAIDQLRLVADRLSRRQTAAAQLALQLRADTFKDGNNRLIGLLSLGHSAADWCHLFALLLLLLLLFGEFHLMLMMMLLISASNGN